MDYNLCLRQAISFFKKHTKDYNEDEVLEIRLIGRKYLPVEYKKFLNENDIFYINHKQIFFNKTEHNKLKKLLNYNDYFILKNFKVCYTLNPRILKKVIKNNRSGYESMLDVRCVGFDFELKEHDSPTTEQLKNLRLFIERFIINVKIYGLENPGIIRSGRGYHVLYYCFPQRITDGKKRWYKSLVEYLVNHFEDDTYRLDPLKDFTRVFSLPGSINYNVDRMVFYDSLPKTCSFLLKNKEDDFAELSEEETNIDDINDLLEWKLLKTGKIPPGERHQLLVLPLKIWLYQSNVSNWKEYENIINKLYKGNENFNPNQFRGGSYKYNTGAVKKWINKNRKWLEDNNIEVEE